MVMDPLDADEPDVSEYHHLPDCEALAEQVKCCLQEREADSNPDSDPSSPIPNPNPNPNPNPDPNPNPAPNPSRRVRR